MWIGTTLEVGLLQDIRKNPFTGIKMSLPVMERTLAEKQRRVQGAEKLL